MKKAGDGPFHHFVERETIIIHGEGDPAGVKTAASSSLPIISRHFLRGETRRIFLAVVVEETWRYD